jgi:hypothetical protein
VTVLAARVVALVAALAALAVAWRRDAPAGRAYVCPMHPEARAPAPGVCAICRMALRAAPPARAAIPDEAVGTPLMLTVAREVSAPAWRDGDGVVALLYGDELALLAPGETAQLHLGRRALALRRDDTPPRPWDQATFTTRWRPVKRGRDGDDSVGGRHGDASVGGRDGDDNVGWLELARRTRATLVVPYSAVIASPAGPYVLVVAGQTLSPRPIVTGRTLFDFITVLGGVTPKERLIVRDAVFFDHQRRLATEAP